MDPHRRPNEKNVAPETHESQPSPNHRPAEEPKLIELTPPVDREIVSDSAAEDAATEVIEPSDDTTPVSPEPRDPFEVPGDTHFDDRPADITAAEPAPIATDHGAEKENENADELRFDVAESSATPADGLSPAASDVVATPPEVVWSSANKAPTDDPGSAWPRAGANRPDAAAHVGSQVPSDLAWSEAIRSFGIEPSEGESGVPGRITAIDPATPPGLVEIPLVRPGERPRIERLPFLYGAEPEGPAVRYLPESDEPVDTASATAAQSRGADMGPRTQVLLSPTSDGGPPLARPMVLVNLPDARTLRIREEALAAAAARDEATLDKIAEAKVDHAFWVRACHERAVWGNY